MGAERAAAILAACPQLGSEDAALAAIDDMRGAEGGGVYAWVAGDDLAGQGANLEGLPGVARGLAPGVGSGLVGVDNRCTLRRMAGSCVDSSVETLPMKQPGQEPCSLAKLALLRLAA